MKKSELKNIIKECVKEVIFEEGILSGIISEVVSGLSAKQINERPVIKKIPSNGPQNTQLQETKRRVLDSIGGDSYTDVKKKFTNPELFEGTKPIVESNGRGPLSGMHPSDPGVDLSSIPGMGSWAAIANKSNERR